MIDESLKSLALAYTILRALSKPFKDMDAYKLGLIDDSGKKLRKAETKEEKSSVDMYNRLIINIKRILQKLTGKSALASAALGVYLLKESTYSEDDVSSIIRVIKKNYTIPYIDESGYDEEEFTTVEIEEMVESWVEEWTDE